jgi:hypothetical protein
VGGCSVGAVSPCILAWRLICPANLARAAAGRLPAAARALRSAYFVRWVLHWLRVPFPRAGWRAGLCLVFPCLMFLTVATPRGAAAPAPFPAPVLQLRFLTLIGRRVFAGVTRRARAWFLSCPVFFDPMSHNAACLPPARPPAPVLWLHAFPVRRVFAGVTAQRGDVSGDASGCSAPFARCTPCGSCDSRKITRARCSRPPARRGPHSTASRCAFA